MKERQLLRAVRRVVRHIEIDRVMRRARAAQPLAMSQSMLTVAANAPPTRYSARGPTPFSNREIIQLRGEGLPLHRIAVEQQAYKSDAFGEPVGIVAIGIAGSDAEDALREHVRQRMRDAGPGRGRP